VAAQGTDRHLIALPAPTGWPIVLAFGVTLLFAGLVTDAAVTTLGAMLAVIAALGWFNEVLPHERHEVVVVSGERVAQAAVTRPVAHLRVDASAQRAWLPLETYPVSAGIKGGIAGGVVMALLAAAYGIVSGNSVWYPINLLAGGFFPEAVNQPSSTIAAFKLTPLLIAVAIHGTTSVLVGLLYGATLPMLPRHPIALGGIVAPIVWSGLLYGVLGILNPVMNQRIDWPWFIASQFGFGVTAGVVVATQERIRTWQRLPLMMRAGFEAPGLVPAHEEDRR